MLEISVDPPLRAVLSLGVLVLEEIVQPARGNDQVIHAVESDVRSRFAEAPAREAFRVEARRLYKAFGIDPTKHRPSSEQLLLRIVKGDPFPRVNPIVDSVNVCQLAFGLPYGLYDLDALAAPIVARTGAPGEAYAGIRKGSISLEGRPCLADTRGPFGNPSSDSDRAKTSDATRRALVAIFGSPAMEDACWRDVLRGTFERFGALGVEARPVEERVIR
jgi:DNA/RNA-binding domain of Phe-tRNA-synthetase-like protein